MNKNVSDPAEFGSTTVFARPEGLPFHPSPSPDDSVSLPPSPQQPTAPLSEGLAPAIPTPDQAAQPLLSLQPEGDATQSLFPDAAPDAAPDAPRHPIQTIQTAILDEAQRLASTPPGGPVTLTLAPEELGTLRFVVQETEQGLHLHLTVDQPATLDLLRRQGDLLLTDLRQSGFHNASLSFAGQEGQSNSQGRNDAHPPMPSSSGHAEASPPEPSRPPATPAAAGTSLNLRL